MMGTDEVASWLLAQNEIEGITLSGGEPMDQAEPIAEVLDLVRAQRDLGVVCYTGYALEQLRASGDVGVARLLRRVDLLIDGPYLRERHRSLLWRASANQRLLALTPRYSAIVEELTPDTDRSAGVEFAVGQSGAILYAGVPDAPDFNAELAVALEKARGDSPPTQPRSRKLKRQGRRR
jgi:anaerobic ribonucleoside-triphosphate reductase activating protein